jgi:hypothetical protein
MRLRDLVRIDTLPSPDAIAAGDRWVFFIVPLAKWPQPYQQKWSRILKILYSRSTRPTTRQTGVVGLDPVTERICLCSTTKGCSLKPEGSLENFDCSRNLLGICIEATLQMPDNHLRLETMGAFLGVTKQRIDQIYQETVESLIRRIYNDPMLREYCQTHGFGV